MADYTQGLWLDETADANAALNIYALGVAGRVAVFLFSVVPSILSGVDDAILEKIAFLPVMQLMSW